MKLRNARYLARDFLDGLIQPGDAVVDATMGNGHDTLYLAQKVGESGRVWAFDVQQAALDATRRRLEDNGCADRVRLILDSHANMAAYVDEPPSAILFNLGWLPTGDHSVTTRVDSTLAAVSAAMELVRPGGAVSVCIYPGHDEGARERLALRQFLAGADIHRFNVLWCEFANQREDSPKLALIQKELTV